MRRGKILFPATLDRPILPEEDALQAGVQAQTEPGKYRAASSRAGIQAPAARRNKRERWGGCPLPAAPLPHQRPPSRGRSPRAALSGAQPARDATGQPPRTRLRLAPGRPSLPFPSLSHRPSPAGLLGGGTAQQRGAAPTNAPGRRRCPPAAAAGPEAPKVWPRLPGPGGTGRGDSGEPGRAGSRARSR